jgi:predicted CXXCH cytochrome family protein
MAASRGKQVVLLVALVAVGIAAFRAFSPTVPPTPEQIPDFRPVTSADCHACHAEQFESWHRTYHRTMTRDATPDTVKGDFNGVRHELRGTAARFLRDGDRFLMELPDPNRPSVTKAFSVDRVVGSHWLQEYLHRDPSGRYIRLPLLYHLGEKRWVHNLGAFLAPDSDDYWARSRGANWNESCLYCHNTEPVKNPTRDVRGRVAGYDTTVTELGIACAACHGPGEEHVHSQTAGRTLGEADVVHPAHLSVERRDQICARCHGSLVPNPAAWDPATHRDPFIPGRDLWRFNSLFKSEAEQYQLAGAAPRTADPPKPKADDGRFWGDGTPLTTALEYNGMALSKCYQEGRGSMSCLSCHTMHGDDPNLLLKPRMQTDAACLQCHEKYREGLIGHTRHAADSPGSRCVNCHMPHQVYSLMATHRSHRIETPTLAGSLGTGKPHACNLCHLDKSLGWTKTELAKWPNGAKNGAGALSAEEEAIAYSVLVLTQGDARSRAVVAGAFSNPDAIRAAGSDWTGSMLVRLAERERYPAVRYLLHRALAGKTPDYDHLAPADAQRRYWNELRQRFDAAPIRRPLPFMPLTRDGLPNDGRLVELWRGASDPERTINE